MKYAFNPIGIIRSCYREKFGIPRQPGLVKSGADFLYVVMPVNLS